MKWSSSGHCKPGTVYPRHPSSRSEVTVREEAAATTADSSSLTVFDDASAASKSKGPSFTKR